MVAGVHIRVESKGNARGASKASGHNERKVVTQKMEQYFLNEADRGENYHHDFGLSVGQLQVEIEANEKAGYKLHHRAKPYKELLFIFEAHHTNHDLVRVAEKLANRFSFRPMQLDVHRDEGSYFDEGRTKLKRRNLHVHLLFTTNNSTNNKQIALGGKKEMREMQKIVSEELDIKLGVGMYTPGGRMDPAKSPSERRPHESHWAHRYRQEEAAKAERKLCNSRRLIKIGSGQIAGLAKQCRDNDDEVDRLKHEITKVNEQNRADRQTLIASGEASQADYQRLKRKKDEEVERLKAKLKKEEESRQTQIRHNYEITIRQFIEDEEPLDSVVDAINDDEKLTEKERLELLEMPKRIEKQRATKKLKDHKSEWSEQTIKPKGKSR